MANHRVEIRGQYGERGAVSLWGRRMHAVSGMISACDIPGMDDLLDNVRMTFFY